jgi:hypothetical protein
MTKNMKTSIAAIATIMTISILTVSCSRGANEEVKIPDILHQDKINPNEVFTLSRNGHMVNIQWQTDFSACKRIDIFRNTTGISKDRNAVATLDSKSQNHEDIVPNPGAFWYWLRIWLPKKTMKLIGPIRIGPDKNNTGKYEEIHKMQVNRNANNVKISWDTPSDNIKQITFRRNTNMYMHFSSRKDIFITRECTGTIDDSLPDPNADYWYWMDISLENGTIVPIGPIKAEFRED